MKKFIFVLVINIIFVQLAHTTTVNSNIAGDGSGSVSVGAPPPPPLPTPPPPTISDNITRPADAPVIGIGAIAAIIGASFATSGGTGIPIGAFNVSPSH